MENVENMRFLTGFQHWLGTNYKTLPTDSGEMTKRARLYLIFLNIEEIKCSYCQKIAYRGHNKGTFINDILMDLLEKGWTEINDKLFCKNCFNKEQL